jgi:hypothetical protein
MYVCMYVKIDHYSSQTDGSETAVNDTINFYVRLKEKKIFSSVIAKF